jgi:hypothetical protein
LLSGGRVRGEGTLDELRHLAAKGVSLAEAEGAGGPLGTLEEVFLALT